MLASCPTLHLCSSHLVCQSPFHEHFRRQKVAEKFDAFQVWDHARRVYSWPEEPAEPRQPAGAASLNARHPWTRGPGDGEFKNLPNEGWLLG